MDPGWGYGAGPPADTSWASPPPLPPPPPPPDYGGAVGSLDPGWGYGQGAPADTSWASTDWGSPGQASPSGGGLDAGWGFGGGAAPDTSWASEWNGPIGGSGMPTGDLNYWDKSTQRQYNREVAQDHQDQYALDAGLATGDPIKRAFNAAGIPLNNVDRRQYASEMDMERQQQRAHDAGLDTGNVNVNPATGQLTTGYPDITQDRPGVAQLAKQTTEDLTGKAVNPQQQAADQLQQQMQEDTQYQQARNNLQQAQAQLAPLQTGQYMEPDRLDNNANQVDRDISSLITRANATQIDTRAQDLQSRIQQAQSGRMSDADISQLQQDIQTFNRDAQPIQQEYARVNSLSQELFGTDLQGRLQRWQTYADAANQLQAAQKTYDDRLNQIKNLPTQEQMGGLIPQLAKWFTDNGGDNQLPLTQAQHGLQAAEWVSDQGTRLPGWLGQSFNGIHSLTQAALQFGQAIASGYSTGYQNVQQKWNSNLDDNVNNFKSFLHNFPLPDPIINTSADLMIREPTQIATGFITQFIDPQSGVLIHPDQAAFQMLSQIAETWGTATRLMNGDASVTSGDVVNAAMTLAMLFGAKSMRAGELPELAEKPRTSVAEMAAADRNLDFANTARARQGEIQDIVRNPETINPIVKSPNVFEVQAPQGPTLAHIDNQLADNVTQNQSEHYQAEGRNDQIHIDSPTTGESWKFTYGDWIDNGMSVERTMQNIRPNELDGTGSSWMTPDRTNLQANLGEEHGIQPETAGESDTAREARTRGEASETSGRTIPGEDVNQRESAGLTAEERTPGFEAAAAARTSGSPEAVGRGAAGQRSPAASEEALSLQRGTHTDAGGTTRDARDVLADTVNKQRAAITEFLDNGVNQHGIVKDVVFDRNLQGEGAVRPAGYWDSGSPDKIYINPQQMLPLGDGWYTRLGDSLANIPEGTPERTQAEQVLQRLGDATGTDMARWAALHETYHAITGRLLGVAGPGKTRFDLALAMTEKLPERWWQLAAEQGLNMEVASVRRIANKIRLGDRLTIIDQKRLPVAASRLFEHLDYQLMAREDAALHPYSLANSEVYKDNVHNFERFQEGVQEADAWYRNALRTAEDSGELSRPTGADAAADRFTAARVGDDVSGRTLPAPAHSAAADARPGTRTTSATRALQTDLRGDTTAADRTRLEYDRLRLANHPDPIPDEEAALARLEPNPSVVGPRPDVEARELVTLADKSSLPVAALSDIRSRTREAWTRALTEGQNPDHQIALAAKYAGYPNDAIVRSLAEEANQLTGDVVNGYASGGAAAGIMRGMKPGEVLTRDGGTPVTLTGPGAWNAGEEAGRVKAITGKSPEAAAAALKDSKIPWVADWDKKGGVLVVDPAYVQLGDVFTHVQSWAPEFRDLVSGAQTTIGGLTRSDDSAFRISPEAAQRSLEAGARVTQHYLTEQTGMNLEQLQENGRRIMRDEGGIHYAGPDAEVFPELRPGEEVHDLPVKDWSHDLQGLRAFQDHLENKVDGFTDYWDEVRKVGSQFPEGEQLDLLARAPREEIPPTQGARQLQLRRNWGREPSFMQEWRQNQLEVFNQALRDSNEGLHQLADEHEQQAMNLPPGEGTILPRNNPLTAAKRGARDTAANQELRGLADQQGRVAQLTGRAAKIRNVATMLTELENRATGTLDLHKVFGDSAGSWARRIMAEDRVLVHRFQDTNRTIKNLLNPEERRQVTEALDVGDLGSAERERRINTLEDPVTRAVARRIYEHWQFLGRLGEKRGVLQNWLDEYVPHMLAELREEKGLPPSNRPTGFVRERQRDEQGNLIMPTIRDFEEKWGKGAVNDVADLTSLHGISMLRYLKAAEVRDYLLADNHPMKDGLPALMNTDDFRNLGAQARTKYTSIDKGRYQNMFNGYMIRKEMAEQFQRATGQIFDHKGLQALDKAWLNITGFTKLLYFTLSPYHIFNVLSRVGAAGTAGDPFLSRTAFGKTPLGIARAVAFARDGASIVRNHPEIVDKWARRGFTLPGQLPEDLSMAMKFAPTNWPGVRHYHHFVFSTVAYNSALGMLEHMERRALLDLGKKGGNPLSPAAREYIGTTLAEHAKNAAGLYNPEDIGNFGKILGRAVLAPHWGMSQLRLLARAVPGAENLPGFRGAFNVIEREGGGALDATSRKFADDYRGRINRTSLTNAAISLAVLAQGANFVSGIMTDGKPRWLWDNAKEDWLRTFDVYHGQVNGRGQYWGLPFYGFLSELLNYGLAGMQMANTAKQGPLKGLEAGTVRTLGKLNPLLQAAIELGTGVELYKAVDPNSGRMDKDKSFLNLAHSMGISENDPRFRLLYEASNRLAPFQRVPLGGKNKNPTLEQKLSALGLNPFTDKEKAFITGVRDSQGIWRDSQTGKTFPEIQAAQQQQTQERNSLQAEFSRIAAKADRTPEDNARLADIANKMGWGENRLKQEVFKSEHIGQPYNPDEATNTIGGHELTPEQSKQYRRQLNEAELNAESSTKRLLGTANLTEQDKNTLVSSSQQAAKDAVRHNIEVQNGWKSGNQIDVNGVSTDFAHASIAAVNGYKNAPEYNTASAQDQNIMRATGLDIAKEGIYAKYGMTIAGGGFQDLVPEVKAKAKDLTVDQIGQMAAQVPIREQRMVNFARTLPEFQDNKTFSAEEQTYVLNNIRNTARQLTEDEAAGVILPTAFEHYIGISKKGAPYAETTSSGAYVRYQLSRPLTQGEDENLLHGMLLMQMQAVHTVQKEFGQYWGTMTAHERQSELKGAMDIGQQEALYAFGSKLDIIGKEKSIKEKYLGSSSAGGTSTSYARSRVAYRRATSRYSRSASRGIRRVASAVRSYRAGGGSNTAVESRLQSHMAASDGQLRAFIDARNRFIHTPQGQTYNQFSGGGNSHLLPEVDSEIRRQEGGSFSIGKSYKQIQSGIKNL